MKNALLIFFILLGFFYPVVFAQTVSQGYADGKIYVKLNRSALKPVLAQNPDNIPLQALPDFASLFAKYGVTKINRPFHQAWEDESLPAVLKLEFSKIKLVNAFIHELESLKGVVYAEKVSYNTIDAVPNDVLYAGLSHLPQINAPAAWNVFNSTANGSSTITVAIVDNAVMWTHADLVANTYTNTGEIPGNNIDDDNNGYKDDVNGFDVADLDNNPIPTNLSMNHGTHCAGIAGATTDNTIGIAAIGWNIKIIPVKCQADGGSTIGVSNGYEGIVYAVRARARIISCSWGNTLGSSITEQSVINFAWNRGCIVIASAGNNNNNSLNYPGAYNNVYCVAAVDNTDAKWSLSSFGTWVDICAPGSNINSTVPYAVGSSTPAYLQLSGTSMATPMVAGLAGLMLSKSPNMTRANVLNCISSTAVNIYTLAGNATYATGNQLGAGRIDAFAAMNCAATYSALPPVANFYAFPLITCPGTTVNLYDSSLYAPTSWNWVIQGGSPATSTLANPIVQWSSPGIYSISLTVANASGTSSTTTKLAYINVTGPQSLPFVEGFQGTQFLPAGWSPRNIGNDPIYWERVTGLGAFGTSTACAMFDNFTYFVSNDRDEMRSPRFNMSNVANAQLRFDVAYARFNATFSDSLEVRVSTNCGSTWTTIYLNGGSGLSTAPDASTFFTPGSTQWRTESVNISTLTAGQSNVLFSFVNRGRYGQPIYIDNINIATPSPTLSASLPTAACVGNSFSVNATINGAAGYTWTLPGTATPSSTLANPAISFTNPGTYTLNVTAVNGTAAVTVSSVVSVFTTPTLALNSPSICSSNSATLVASGSAASYSWNNATGSSSLVVAPLSTSVYTLTGNNGGACSASATGTIFVTPTPTVSAASQSICVGNQATLTATGAGTYSWSTGASGSVITVSPAANTVYTVTGSNGTCSNTRTLSVSTGTSLSVQLSAGSQTICTGAFATVSAQGASTYTWSNGSNSSSIAVTSSLTTTLVYTVTGATGNCSGTATASIKVNQHPTVTVLSSPGTSLCAGASATLSASGANTYTWSTGATGNAIVISPSTNTVYTVTGGDPGCTDTQSIAIAGGLTQIVVSALASQLTVCAGQSVALVASGANTYTWSNAASGASVVINPTITTNYTVTGGMGNCTGSAALTIKVNPLPQSGLSTKQAGCNNACKGEVNATTTGGLAPYTYSLGTGPCPALPCNNLCQGIYTLVTADANGCQSFNIFTISPSVNNLNALVTSTAATCFSCPDGKLDAGASGGQPPLTYNWQPSGGNAATATGLLPGCYTVTITDTGTCTYSAQSCVGSIDGLTEYGDMAGRIQLQPNPSNDKVTVLLSGINGEAQISVYNSIGQLVLSNKVSEKSSQFDTTTLPEGVYLVVVRQGQRLGAQKLVIAH